MESESILNTVKKMLNVHEDETHFDTDIIVSINSSFMILNDLGVGPEEPYHIFDSTNTWEEFEGCDLDIHGVKTLIYLRARLIFDPPSNGFVTEAMERQIAELEWRLRTRAERDRYEIGGRDNE